MIINRSIIDTQFGSFKQKEILCSSTYATPKSYGQYFRETGQDPQLLYKLDNGKTSLMYGEHGKYACSNNCGQWFYIAQICFVHALCSAYGGHSENILKDGMNVWIYLKP